MKRLFKNFIGKNEVTKANIDTHVRILISQTRELIRRETKILEAAEGYASRWIKASEPEQSDQAIRKYIISNHRLDALEALLQEVISLQAYTYDMATSSVPPLPCELPLKDVLVVASTLKIQAFITFRRAILERLYTSERVATLGLRHNMNPVIERGLFTTDVTDAEFNEAVRAIAANNEISEELSSKALKKVFVPPPLSYPTVVMPDPVEPVVKMSTRHSLRAKESANLTVDLGTKYEASPDIFVPVNIGPISRDEWDGLMLEVAEATSYD